MAWACALLLMGAMGALGVGGRETDDVLTRRQLGYSLSPNVYINLGSPIIAHYCLLKRQGCWYKLSNYVLFLTCSFLYIKKKNRDIICTPFTIVKRTIQWVLVYSQGCTTIAPNSRTFSSLQKRNPTFVRSHSPFPPPHRSGQPVIYFLSL